MQRKKSKVEAALQAKGFVEKDTHHHYYIYETLEGKKTSVFTKTSHGSGKDLDDYLLTQMARQCQLTKMQFLDLIDCPLDRQKYEQVLGAKQKL